jgi:hypothetical protein
MTVGKMSVSQNVFRQSVFRQNVRACTKNIKQHLSISFQDVAPGIAYLSFVCILTFVVSFAIGLGENNVIYLLA